MSIKINYQRLPLLFFVSLLCVFYGLGASHINQAFGIPDLAVGVIGGILLIVTLFLFNQAANLRTAGSAFARGVSVAIYILLWLLLFGGANYLAYRFNVRFDLTRYKQHTLSQNTKAVIKQLDRNIKITVLYVGYPPKYLEDLLKEYQASSGGIISTEIIDPIEQIGYAAQFGNVISGKERKAIVQSVGETPQRTDVDFTENPLTENLLTNALVTVTRPARDACFLKGHQEYSIASERDDGLSQFNEMLKSNNYNAHELLIGQNGKIPEECDLLVVAGPRDELSTQEEEVIKGYLNNGGDAFFLIEHTVVTTPDKPLTEEEFNKNPSLNNILKDWGMRVNNDIIVDLSSHASGDVGSPATRNYMAHRKIVNNLDYTFYIRPRSISVLNERRNTIKIAPFILSESKGASWGETDRMLNVHFDETADRPGPVPFGFIAYEEKGLENSQVSRLAVITDADFISNAYVNLYSNAEMGLNIISWLTDSDYQVYVEEKDVSLTRLDLTSRQKRVVAVILVLIPALILSVAVAVWMRQKL